MRSFKCQTAGVHEIRYSQNLWGKLKMSDNSEDAWNSPIKTERKKKKEETNSIPGDKRKRKTVLPNNSRLQSNTTRQATARCTRSKMQIEEQDASNKMQDRCTLRMELGHSGHSGIMEGALKRRRLSVGVHASPAKSSKIISHWKKTLTCQKPTSENVKVTSGYTTS